MEALAQTVGQAPLSSHYSAAAVSQRPAPHDPLALVDQFGTTLTIEREREIHGQGDKAQFCYRVISGCVRLVKLMADGRRQVSAFLMPGEQFGFDSIDTHDFAAEAVTDTVVRRIPRRTVEALAEQHVALSRRLRELTAGSLRTAHMQLILLGRKTACERIASFLIEMAGRLPARSGKVMALPMSRTDIADHLGLTIETVCRTLAHLRREGIIVLTRGGVEIRDYRTLTQIASDIRH